MAQGLTTTANSRLSRPVSVEVGVAPARRADAAPPELCMVALASPDDPLLADVMPRAMVRDTRFREDDAFVEHVRVQSRDVLDALPGLSVERPSRLRDAVKLAISAGARSVDIVMARVRGLMPWDLDKPEVVYAIDPFMSNMIGACVVYPDIGGPIPLGPGTAVDMDTRVDRYARVVRAHGPRWVERYQLALLDDPGASGALSQEVVRATAGSDASICRWVGDTYNLKAHGWRSAGAFVGGLIAARPGDLLRGVVGFGGELAPGRAVSRSRHEELTVTDRWVAGVPEDTYYVDVVPDADAGRALVRSDPTMRSPVGAWSIPAVRVAKVIHWRVMHAASKFVFEMADIGHAVSLAAAVTKTLDPYVKAGVLVGPEGAAEPVIRGGVVRSSVEPGLRVEISAMLLPWAHRVNVRVHMRSGSDPVIEEVA